MNSVNDTSFEVRLERTIDDISSAEWDRLNAPQGIFCTHRFLRIVEKARVENARFYYVLVYSGKKLVGTAVLSRFVVSLDLLITRRVQYVCAIIRKIWPTFMRVQILFCGIPISIGKHTLAFGDEVSPRDILPSIFGCMKEVARQDQLRYMCFKEFPESRLDISQSLCDRGFFKANSIPRILLPVRWSKYGDYLSQLRHGFRRQILASMKKFGSASERPTGTSDSAASPRLVIGDGTICPPAVMHSLYMQVINHTVVKLEVLNAAFFDLLFSELRDDIRLLVITKDSEALAVAILCEYDKRLTFMFVGFDYSRRDEYALYLNILNEIVRHGIERRCIVIDLGQTSYWLKQRIGGEAERMFFFLRAENLVVHFVLKTLRKIIFPATKLPSPRVFRD